jgi:dTDP-glucose 4,6-dehydratase
MGFRNKKVLVTGSEGFIGSHLVEALLKEGAKVRAFVLYNSFNNWGWLDTFPKNNIRKLDVVTGDIRDYNCVHDAVGGMDIVFNLAALVAIPFSYRSQDSYVDTNIKGTLNILQAARKLKPQKIIHTSTSEVYGTAQYMPIDETHPITPQSPYAATKAAADYMALSFYSSFNLPVTILRPFNTFGPRQSARAVIPTIITQVLSGKRTIKLGNLETTRDFNYVSNTVDAFLKIAQTRGTEGEFFNVGSGKEVSIKQLAGIIFSVLGKKVDITTDDARLRPPKSEVMRLICDYKKLNDICGWTPKVTLEDGIRFTCDWLKRNLNKYKPDIYNI